MTVKELIELLKDQPQDQQVYFKNHPEQDYWGMGIFIDKVESKLMLDGKTYTLLTGDKNL